MTDSKTRTIARSRKFLSYYRPYLGLLLADLACSLIVSATTLILPLCASVITKDILSAITPQSLPQIYGMGAVMLALVAVNTASNMFVD